MLDSSFKCQILVAVPDNLYCDKWKRSYGELNLFVERSSLKRNSQICF